MKIEKHLLRSGLGIVLAIVNLVFVFNQVAAQDQLFDEQDKFTRADRLRGSVTPEREWWDLKHYDLWIEVFPETRKIRGSNEIKFSALKAGQKMQIDLQQPLEITKVEHGDKELKYEREGNVYWINFENEILAGTNDSIKVFYSGKHLLPGDWCEYLVANQRSWLRRTG